ncbi:MAG: hypothetical protein KIT25_06365 [Enhydrobacter sp.]|nr:MAG: hypothetical protein KIT25_06365 [Enhydrobacter sp.]
MTTSQRHRRLDDAFRWLMSDPRGRFLLWDRLERAGVFRTSMAGDPHVTAFHEGLRQMGLHDFAQLMRLCPEELGRMAREATQPGEHDDGRSD